MIDLDTIVTSARMEDVHWTIDEFLRVYDAILSLWEVHGWMPDRVAGVRPKRDGYYDEFDDSHRHPKKKHIKFAEGIVLVRMTEGWKSDTEWAARACFSNYNDSGHAYQVIGQTQLDTSADVALDVNRRFLQTLNGRYAYILRQQRRFGYYQMAASQVKFWTQPRDHSMNISWWSMNYPKPLDARLLRDIYPYNYLSQPYLNATLGTSRTTLREWIGANPAERGELRRFSDTLTEWTPPVENIPVIREALFRAGRLFYWRFFNPMNRRKDALPILEVGWHGKHLYEPEPCYRPDLMEPWEAKDPIPEIYQADFYKDKDPGLIY